MKYFQAIKQKWQRKWAFWGCGIALLLAAIFGFGFYNHYHPSTDDAYVNTDVVYIAAQVSGPIDSIQVQDHEFVHKGQLLFTIDPRRFQYAVDKANADLQQATENSTANPNVNAMKVAALAALENAQLNLSYTKIYAPIDGYLTNFSLSQGSSVIAGMTLFQLVGNKKWWIDANFKETQLTRIRPGQLATVELDSYPGVKFKGIVDSISPGSGAAFSLLPPENATGNWVKVTQRFPVKVLITEIKPGYPLRVGASSTVTVDTLG